MNKNLINEMMVLINEGDYYIIFNDGKPIRTNLPDEVNIEMNNYFSASDYAKNAETQITEEITQKAIFSPTINITTSANIKIIHLNKKETYIDYHLIVAENLSVNITNIYYRVTNKAKIKMDLVCKDDSCVIIKNITNAYDDLNMHIRSFCLQGAQLRLDDLVISDKKVNYYSAIYLVDNNSACEMNNIIINTTGQVQVFDYKIIHDALETISHMNSYGITKNTSNLVINCWGRIEKNAKNAQMFQKTKGLIMDLSSSIISSPILEIEENEVIANHGAAIGAIDDDELYYLMSRGLNRIESERLIINTYIAPFYANISDKTVLAHIHEEIKTQFAL